MSAQPVDAAATSQRISRMVRAIMAARGIREDKELANTSGVNYDTLLRRLNGKPWVAHELLAVASALEVDVATLMTGDPDDWFPRAAVPVAVTVRKPAAAAKVGKRRNLVYNSAGLGSVAA